jgi:DNA-binding response OmpR family regulator
MVNFLRNGPRTIPQLSDVFLVRVWYYVEARYSIVAMKKLFQDVLMITNQPKKRILVVEDEANIAQFLKRGLTYKGFDVRVAWDGQQALREMQTFAPDLVVLDIMLPGMDGYEVCRRLRARSDDRLQIVILTAKDELSDKVIGLDSGADDYVTKPFVFEELLARIRARLRRSEAKAQRTKEIVVGDLVIDTAARQVCRGGDPVELTTREYDLLELLAQHAGQVLPKEVIFERTWGYDNEAGLEIIKVYINYLRSR